MLYLPEPPISSPLFSWNCAAYTTIKLPTYCSYLLGLEMHCNSPSRHTKKFLDNGDVAASRTQNSLSSATLPKNAIIVKNNIM